MQLSKITECLTGQWNSQFL